MRSTRRAPIVRVSPHSHDVLQEMARDEGQSMQQVLDEAIESLRRDRFLRGGNEDFEALKRNSKAWKQQLRERDIWEQTAADGMDEK